MKKSRKTQKNRKGGVRIRQTKEHTVLTALHFFIENSSFSIFSRGFTSIIVKLELNAFIESPYMTTRLGNFNKPVRELLFKFVVCNKNPNEPCDDQCEIMLTNIKDFENDANVQEDIYKKSFLNETTFLEPICPCMLYSTRITDDKYKEWLLSVMQKTMSTQDFLRIQQIFKHDVGYTAMESMELYKPLETFITSPKYPLYVLFAMHQLRVMHRLGYKHCDFHLNNILINESYNYYDFVSGHAIIIDFTQSTSFRSADTTNIHVMNKLIQREIGFLQISEKMFEQMDFMDFSRRGVQQNDMHVIQSRLSRPLRDYLPVLRYRGGNMENKKEEPNALDDSDVFHTREGEWTLPSDDVVKKMFADLILQRLQKCNPERYDSLKKTLDELETMDDDYIERLFYAQFNGLIVPEKLSK